MVFLMPAFPVWVSTGNPIKYEYPPAMQSALVWVIIDLQIRWLNLPHIGSKAFRAGRIVNFEEEERRESHV